MQDFSDILFTGNSVYAILSNDGFEIEAVYDNHKEAKKECKLIKKEIDDPTCNVWAM